MTNRFEDNNNSNKSNKSTKIRKFNKNNKSTFKHNIVKRDIAIDNFKKILEENTIEPNINLVKNEIQNPLINVETLQDLIKLSKMALEKDKDNIQYILPVQRLAKILKPLEELNSVVGLDDIKNNLVEQIIYLVSHCDEKEPPMLHTIIDGPPGTGKTKIAKIIGKIISNIGYLKKQKPKTEDKKNFTSIAKMIKDTLVIDIIPEKETTPTSGIVKYVTRSDLVGGYLGQTAIKTQKAIDEASGGILIIDEAYSLGGKRGNEETDSYSQECIDTLVSNLSENRSFVCIILGYEDEIKNSFLSKNKGMESRFPFKYTIKKYTIDNLLDILKNKITLDGFEFKKDIFKNFKKKNPKDFKYLGRDMEILWFRIKMCHTLRIFTSDTNNKQIDEKDINKGLEQFFKNRYKKEERDISFMRMYL